MLDAISSVVSAVAAQSVTAKDEAQTKNTNTASKDVYKRQGYFHKE